MGAEVDNMVVIERGEYKFFIDGYHKANLDHLKKNVKKDYDAFILYVGREGSGKSTLAMQDAIYLDESFTVARVVFNAEQFVEAVTKADKYQAIVFDETMGYLSSRGSMSKFNRTLIKVMAEMRSKNLFILMCIPNFFMMDWYVAEHRTTGLIHIYERGKFQSYDYPTKKKLYILGKKMHAYCVRGNFYGCFPKCFPVDKEKYEVKKQRAIAEFTSVKTKDERWKGQRDTLIKELVSRKLMAKKEIAELIGVDASLLSKND